MKVFSRRYPGLLIRDLGVRFVRGEADVDSKTATELRKLPAELGIETGEADEYVRKSPAPAKPRARRSATAEQGE